MMMKRLIMVIMMMMATKDEISVRRFTWALAGCGWVRGCPVVLLLSFNIMSELSDC